MAIQGTLEDLDILDLVQFAHRCRQSGELCVSDEQREQTASLFYDQGRLLHARMGESEGIDVLVELSAWKEGSFEFRTGLASPEVSIDLDVTQAIMKALQIADERRLAESEARSRDPYQPVRELLQDALDSHPFLDAAILLDVQCQAVCEVMSESAGAKSQEWRKPLELVLSAGVLPECGRVFLESDEHRACLARLRHDGYILLHSPGGALGALSLALSKLSGRLNGLRAGISDPPAAVADHLPLPVLNYFD